MVSFFSDVIKLGSPELSRRFSFMDIGARGGISWPWSKLPPELVSLVLVEPDPEEASRLQLDLLSTDRGMILPCALWRDDVDLSLHLNRWPATSSCYAANRMFLNQFPESERFDPLRIVPLKATSIDSLAADGVLPDVDFTKIDVQGAELPILEGGERTFASGLIGLEVEVEFAEMYSGQPLFCDVDRFVRGKLGLELWDLQTVHWKYRSGMNHAGPPKGRLIFGDALYLRPLTNIQVWLGEMPTHVAKEKSAMLVIAAIAYGFIDYASAVLSDQTVSRYIDPQVKAAFQKAISVSTSGFRPFKYGNRYLYWMLNAFAQALRPTYNGWAYGGNGLGNRRRGPFWR